MDPNGASLSERQNQRSRSWVCRWVYRINPAIVAALFMLAGLLKLVSPEAFERSVYSWTLIPEIWIVPIVLLIPPVEFALGIAWFLDIRRAEAETGIAVLLVAFSVVYIAHLAFLIEPDCGCFGALRGYIRQTGQARIAIGRNSILLALLLPSIITRIGRKCRR